MLIKKLKIFFNTLLIILITFYRSFSSFSEKKKQAKVFRSNTLKKFFSPTQENDNRENHNTGVKHNETFFGLLNFLTPSRSTC